MANTHIKVELTWPSSKSNAGSKRATFSLWVTITSAVLSFCKYLTKRWLNAIRIFLHSRLPGRFTASKKRRVACDLTGRCNSGPSADSLQKVGLEFVFMVTNEYPEHAGVLEYILVVVLYRLSLAGNMTFSNTVIQSIKLNFWKIADQTGMTYVCLLFAELSNVVHLRLCAFLRLMNCLYSSAVVQSPNEFKRIPPSIRL